MGTTGHGIDFPESGDPPQAWVDFENMANSIEAAFDAYETWHPWTPVFTTGGFSSYGSGGGAQAHYQDRGGRIHAEFLIKLGSGFAVTAGIMVMTLPVVGYGWSGDAFLASLGIWNIRDDSVPDHYTGGVFVSGSGAVGMVFGGAWDGTSPDDRVSNTSPMAWAAGDLFSAVIDYRAA